MEEVKSIYEKERLLKERGLDSSSLSTVEVTDTDEIVIYSKIEDEVASSSKIIFLA